MLSDINILEILKNNEISISVSFYKNGNEFRMYNQEMPLLQSGSATNLYSDRLKLTMGPVIKVISKQSVKRKYAFKNTSNYMDLRKNNYSYTIDPGESIIILTNENIKLNGKYSCIVIPRISLSDVGIIVSSAYVDPYYQGVLRLQLSNLSNKPYDLKVLEAVAQCFFFELKSEASVKYKDGFSIKSVFFGQTWAEILESDREPFPTKKIPSESNRMSIIKQQLGIIGQFLKKHSIIFIVLTNFFAIVTGYSIIKQDYYHYRNIVSQIEEWLEPILSEIIIEPNETEAKKEVLVDIPKADIVTVLCNNDSIHFELFSGSSTNETKIVFIYTSNSSDVRREIDFTYIIVRRTKR